MPESTLQELRDKLHKVNDNYHEVVDEILMSAHIKVEHKAIVGSGAKEIFDLMNELNKFLDNL